MILYNYTMRNKEILTLNDLFKSEHIYSLVTGLVLVGFSLIVYHFANEYAFEYLTRSTTNYVGDVFLDNLPIVDLNFLIIETALIAMVAVTVFIIFCRSHYVLFSLKALAIFNITRAFFISLTHIGIYPGQTNPGIGLIDGVYSYYNFETGFFFSAHTGLPFFFALIFWKEKKLRYAFLALSFVFAVGVLLSHVHYSIDVLAAPFMAYGIFKVAEYIFPHDFEFIGTKHVQ